MLKKIIIAGIVISVLVLMIFFLKPQHHISRSFYYWKSSYVVSAKEEQLLDILQVTRMYVKYFDVDWNEQQQKPVPVSTINFSGNLNVKREIVPVVFIVNKVMINTTVNEVAGLADNIARRIKSISDRNHILYKEVQFDCDWTDKSRNSYFLLLRELKKHFTSTVLSSTIRLHQVKYKQRTGIPPVDRGMLMFYNMGNIESMDTSLSVFDLATAKKYVDEVSDYPLSLDVALPVFSWGIHRRGSRVISLMNITSADLQGRSALKKLQENIWLADTGFFFRGEYFMKGDVLKMEELTPHVTKEAIDLLLPEIKSTTFSVAFYHFDSTNTSHYETRDFETMYHRFD